MKQRLIYIFACAALPFAPFVPCAIAAELLWAGVVGNSGEQGAALVRSTYGRAGGGLVLDAQGRIFTAGGDRLLVLDRAGTLIRSIALPKTGWVIGSPSFAIVNRHLYFIAGEPVPMNKRWSQFEWTMVEPNVCRVAISSPDAAAEIVCPSTEFADYSKADRQMDISLAANPDASALFIGYNLSWMDNPTYAIDRLSDGHLRRQFTLPVRGQRFSIDEHGDLFVGGGGTIRKFDAHGQPIAGFPSFKFPVRLGNADFYSGAVMLTPGAIWESGGYGFVGRYTRDLKENPGTLAQWNHALDDVAQVAEAGDDLFYMKSTEAVYVVRVRNDQLELVKRFGSLSQLNDVGLTSEGYIAAGQERTVLWFDFDSSKASAAPVRTQYTGPTAQGFNDGEGWISLQGNGSAVSVVRYKPEPFNESGNAMERFAQGTYQGNLCSVARVGAFLFAADTKNNCLTFCGDGSICNFERVAAGVKLAAAPTSLTQFAKNILVVAVGQAVEAFEVDAKGAPSSLWRLTAASAAQDRFGDELHVSASGGELLIADTRRHRVLLFVAGDDPRQSPTFAAQFGETDFPGDNASHLNAPTLNAINSGRAIVYDSANQRLVKLRIR